MNDTTGDPSTHDETLPGEPMPNDENPTVEAGGGAETGDSRETGNPIETGNSRETGKPAEAEAAEQARQAEERLLRVQAELENFRKRARRELDEERRYALLPLIADILPVLDNLDRAIDAAEQNEGAAGLLDGVKMVAALLNGVLERYHCVRIQDFGEPFDPNLHEAIGQEETADFENGSICRVTRTGYRLHERVVRPSQVMIATTPASHRESAADDGTADA